MRPAIKKPQIEPVDDTAADRLDLIFSEIEPNKRGTPVESLELASDLWELARMRHQYRE